MRESGSLMKGRENREGRVREQFGSPTQARPPPSVLDILPDLPRRALRIVLVARMLDLKSPSVGERFDGRVRTLAMASLFVVRLRDDEADVVRGIWTEDLQRREVSTKTRGKEERKKN